MAIITAAQLARRLASMGAVAENEFRKTSRGLGIAAVKFTREKQTAEIYAIPIPTREQYAAERRHRKAIKEGRIPVGTPFVPAAARRDPLTRRVIQRGQEKAWKRTGHLRRSERYEQRGSYIVAIVNDAVYARRRHELGKPKNPETNRPSHWRDDLLKTFRPIVLEANRQTVLALLRRGRN